MSDNYELYSKLSKEIRPILENGGGLKELKLSPSEELKKGLNEHSQKIEEIMNSEKPWGVKGAFVAGLISGVKITFADTGESNL